MFRIDFVDRLDYDTVLHSLSVADGLDNVKLSADKLAGVNYFSREPKRLTFNCLNDGWMDDNIFDGNNEHERYISHFEIRLYHADSLLFHGIIDTQFAKQDHSTGIASFTCYDRLRLFAIYKDLRMVYALTSGYHAGWCMDYLATGITSRLDLSLPTNTSNFSPLMLPNTDALILSIDWHALLMELGSGAALGINIGWSLFNSSTPELKLVMWRNRGGVSERYNRIIARTWRFYNKLAALHIEAYDINEDSEEFAIADTAGLEAARQAILSDYYASTAWIDNWQMIYNSGIYNFPAIVAADYSTATAPEFKEVEFSGQPIPSHIFPKGFYESGGTNTIKLNVLKAALFLHNLTIIADNTGTLHLVNKDDNSLPAIKPIADHEVLKFSRNRINSPAVDTSVLDILLGDLSVLKTIMTDYYNTFLASKWEVALTIDNLKNHDLGLFDRISYKSKTYRLVSVEPDYINDEYNVKGWEI